MPGFDEYGHPSEDMVMDWEEHNAHADDAEPDDEPANLIGPLTAEEWCEFRQRDEDDLLQCCGVTSAFRDALFHLLRMGGDRAFARMLARLWPAMEAHGFPQGDEVTPMLDKLRAYYIDPPATGPEATS
ncbi:hypothetical protein OOJ91_12870 [Micromonospora lupini]|uniref:hypothetical protein n=1 Tax=Micromonospora lupini TaxID=285679 RepID=UPI002259C258|nr:hypothetical protein [Micromonospora lupini]MCX5066739.1 hypothetical protein [Micromonospora lupini]